MHLHCLGFTHPTHHPTIMVSPLPIPVSVNPLPPPTVDIPEWFYHKSGLEWQIGGWWWCPSWCRCHHQCNALLWVSCRVGHSSSVTTLLSEKCRIRLFKIKYFLLPRLYQKVLLYVFLRFQNAITLARNNIFTPKQILIVFIWQVLISRTLSSQNLFSSFIALIIHAEFLSVNIRFLDLKADKVIKQPSA